LFDLGGLQTELTQVAGQSVDILTQLPTNPYIKPQVERDLLPLYEEWWRIQATGLLHMMSDKHLL